LKKTYPTLENESRLLLLIAKGDEQAFRNLFDHYRDRIYSLAMHVLRQEILAEEIVQDVFMRVWQHRTKLDTVQYFPSYLKTIARNVVYDYLRLLATQKRLEQAILQQTIGNTIHSQTPILLKEYERHYQEAIDSLSPKRREAYLLQNQHGLKASQISEQMGISLYTTKEHLKLATRHIRSYMDKRIGLFASLVTALFFE
jgi:RNA polymerase sigma-70 factor (family 1)